MPASANAFLLTAASGLVIGGVEVIKSNIVTGAVMIVLGFGAFLLYEKLPVSK